MIDSNYATCLGFKQLHKMALLYFYFQEYNLSQHLLNKIAEINTLGFCRPLVLAQDVDYVRQLVVTN